MDNSKYWNVDLTSDALVMNVSMTRVQAPDAQRASQQALSLMKTPPDWRVVGIDRA
ncbi:hypothetical protein [Achromobacter aegrifaciens]|uniref:hypothetical protein n=1 Tax=Achromobacter aegrifaciens TaxID=1287736 RepID=UPI001419967A|nr:hypothetical protein [Achromobacter aegrifaciens]